MFISPNVYFPLSIFPIAHGYHGKGFNDLKCYLEQIATKNNQDISSNTCMDAIL